MTLTDLKNYVKDTLQSSEATFVSNLDLVVRNAEKRVHNRVVMPDAKATKQVDGDETVADQQNYEFTANILAPLRVYLNVGDVLQRKPMAWIREVSAYAATEKPLFYGWLNSTATKAKIAVWPVPSANWELYMDYVMGIPPSLVDAATWLSTNYPEVLRKVAVHEGAVFLKDNDLMDRYKVEAEEAITMLGQIVGAPQRDEFR